MNGAQDQLRKQLIPRIDKILDCNGIPIDEFSESMWEDLMKNGRGKYRNIMLVGPTNCGKTFFVDPIIMLLDNVFANAPSSLFSWLGVENPDAVFLNDFRWAPPKHGGCIELDDFLQLLEGRNVTLPAPMNSYTKHTRVTTDIPIIATSSMVIRY